MTPSLPTAAASYILDRIETAIADAEYARLVNDTDRSTRAMKEAVMLARSFRRLHHTRVYGAPVVVKGPSR